MSVVPSESITEVWTRWQGQVINGVFPLGRYLGCSDHSGVFLTKAGARRPSEVAIKLVPASRILAESIVPRWKRAAGLAHPRLLRLLEWGGCQLDGLPYLYAVMEYADQTLAQLLQHRALTDEEAREMLAPALDALAFLHGRNLLQGQLKPANILVVGDQLKLASDTIRRISDGPASSNALTLYDPPEARQGVSSSAGDIWALGVSLCEALTRRTLPAWSESTPAVVLPGDLSPDFRELVLRCLSRGPQDRPSATELLSWSGGGSAICAPDATSQAAPVGVVAPEPAAPRPLPPATVPPVAAVSAQSARSSGTYAAKPRALNALMLVAAAILVLGWMGVRVLRSRHVVPTPPQQARPTALPEPRGGAARTQASAASASAPAPTRSQGATAPAAGDEVLPEVPPGARRTIRGHIKVWVRVIVDPHGLVFAAVADRAGPSSYFERLAVEAAKKWIFPRVDSPSERLMQIRFDFTREGTTGRAVTLP
jgi:hypothetical protein